MISVIESQPAGSGTDLVRQTADIFSPTGLLSQARNFEFRPQQQEMAVAVARALDAGEHLAVEAGTGVGKSFAYLVPAILYAVANRKKAVIATHTINLQEQLTQKDLPVLAQVLPVKFSFAMLKGRANYLCTRRLRKALQQAPNLFTTSETQELQRIAEWARTTEDGSRSDFDVEPDLKVWDQVCSERGLCAPKLCGYPSDFAREHGVCFFQRARQRILSADVVVLNHTLLFTLLGGQEESADGGILFRNDFVIFDEAHQMEHEASKHIGLTVSSGQVRYALHRLWNPRTEKGLLATLRKGAAVKLVAELLAAADGFFASVEHACDELLPASRKRIGGGGDASGARRREWTELRIRRPELVPDKVTLPLQRLREAVADLIEATTSAAARSAVRSLSGEFSRQIHELVDRLISLRMLVEATLDFPEEEVDFLEAADARGRLAQLYASEVPPDTMRIDKQREFGQLEFRYEQLRARWGGYAGYDGWFARLLNNAHLAAVATYEDCVPGLRHTLQAAGSLPAFYDTVEATRPLDLTARHAQLCGAPLGMAR